MKIQKLLELLLLLGPLLLIVHGIFFTLTFTFITEMARGEVEDRASVARLSLVPQLLVRRAGEKVKAGQLHSLPRLAEESHLPH